MDSRPKTLDLLLHVMRELRRNYDAGAAELGLTMARARVLTTLAGMEGATQAELATALQIEAPTLKRQIDGLERLGFIERRGIDGDARKRALFLTEKARASGISRFVLAVRAELFEGIAAEDRAVLDRALSRMVENTARIGEKWGK
ncbi:MarR family winged helix-turn-helix transcriptional regulator [Gemmobacter serpentinus]|uniref:MarR family winged helix-turn-helix transcriptional regulator n=1 Tax=Gemmobacter serpentinus TaxID=2652247 RepID=UPI00124E1CDA|nr:MarR family transcriptional regulator [Gemmobacter serpentinus]